jgi:cytochrome P450
MKLVDINLCDLEQFTAGCPEIAFKLLRAQAPVWFHPPNEQTPGNEGFWVIARHADAKAVLKNHQVFSSETGNGARIGGGTTLDDMATDMAPGVVLAMMDPPKHDAIRGIVNQGFYPKNLAALEGQIQALTDAILSDALADIENTSGGNTHSGRSREIDFLQQIAAQLPLQTICTIGGVPREDWPKMLEWAEAAIAFAAHDRHTDTAPLIAKLTEMGLYAYGLIQQLRERPTGSIMSTIVHAQIPGEDDEPRQLDDLELIRFFNLLITGGTETTRNAIAGGFYQLLQHPDQYHALEGDLEGLIDDAVEEILRWTSPVHFNRRTASENCTFAGKDIQRGDKVTVWYPSANRDESVFDAPYSFNIFRTKNPHIAFGHGIHHCLGAALARQEIRIMISSLINRLRGKKVEAVAAPVYLRSNRHQGISELRLRIS